VWCAILQSLLASANHHNGKALTELHPTTSYYVESKVPWSYYIL
jgi:hypothetical protein